MASLAYKRILITRTAAQADELAALLCERGALPLLYPCIAVAPPQDTDALDAALMSAIGGGYDWLVLTSANTVAALATRLDALGYAADALAGRRVAAVGAATAKAAHRRLGMTVEALPERYHAAALADVMPLERGARVLLPQGDLAPPDLALALQARGARVTTITAYHTTIGSGGVDLRNTLDVGIDAITFTSGSCAHNFVCRLVADGIPRSALDGVLIACIGSSTCAAAEALGFRVTIVPPVYTLPALVGSLEDYLHAR